MREEAHGNGWRELMRPQLIYRFLEGRSAIVIPLSVFAYCAYRNSGQWTCGDDPLTFWASIGASSWTDVLRRSAVTSHLPTYFWIARLFGECCGGMAGIRLSSLLFWLATICWVFFLLRRLEPHGEAGLLCAVFLSYVTPMPWIYSCGRPYAALAFLTLMALHGLVLIYEGRPKLGCLLVALGSGLSTHMLLLTIPTALAIATLAGFLLSRRREPLSTWFVLAAVSLALLAPTLAKAAAMAERAAMLPVKGGHQVFWLKGAPLRLQLVFIVLPAAFGLSIIAFRRLRLLDPPSSFAISDAAVFCLTILGLIFPCASLFLYYRSGLDLFAPWYNVQGLLMILILGSLLLGTGRDRTPRLALEAGFLLGLAIFSGIIDAQIRAYLKPRTWRGPLFQFIVEHSTSDDLVVVVSPWFESRFWSNYKTPLRRSYLLADTLMVPGVENLQMFPAPGGTEADQTEPTPSLWTAAIRSMAKDHNRIWFLDSPSLETDSAEDRLNAEYSTLHSLSGVGSVLKFHGEEGWSFKRLVDLGYRSMPDAVPSEFHKQLFVLEKPRPN